MSDIKFSQNDVTLDDMKDITLLLSQLSSSFKKTTYEHIQKVMQNGIIFTARNDGVLVGMATLTFIYKPTAFFGTTEDVVVDKSFRGKGIAKNLMTELIKKARALEMKQIDLTSKPQRESANNFYLSLNFNLRQTNCYRLILF